MQKDGENFIELCRDYFFDNNTEKEYYRLRSNFNDPNIESEVKGALFLYLNKHGYNGLCRYNAAGKFNVPFGHKKVAPAFPEKELLHAFEKSIHMNIHECSFGAMFRIVKKGDVVYCDPPYLPLSKTSSFTTYSAGEFGFMEHAGLVGNAEQAQKNGATVIISNNDVPAARKLYKDATEIHSVDVRKNISCKGDGRKKQKEIIAVYRPK